MNEAGGTRRKRFYKEVTVAPVEQQTPTEETAPQFRVLLDGRGVRTPAKHVLTVPSLALAEALADEWRAQKDHVDPSTMPLTRIANSAIDGVAGRETEVRADILAYGGSDLICYLAEGPPDLIERQSRRWGEIHAWAKSAFDVVLELAVGIMPVTQDPAMLARLDAAMGPRDHLELAALHVMTASMGSVLLSLAVLHARLSPEDAWAIAHIDEDHQIERWGEDEEAMARRTRRWNEMSAAAKILASLRQKQSL